ncbi:MAG: HPP family protein [Candidatus Binataceae bacterium]
MASFRPDSSNFTRSDVTTAAAATPSAHFRLRIASEILALAYISIIATVASATGAFYVMFPELGALAYDVLTRPRGRWCSSPVHLATTPALTGVVGIAITRSLAYGMPSVVATVAGALVIVLGLGSPIAPSISAGLLPLTVDIQSWWYPPGILLGTMLLAGISLVWKPFLLRRGYRGISIDEVSHPLGEGAHPRALHWIVSLFAFVAVGTGAVHLTGQRFVLFPPLVVIGYEMMRHPSECPWAHRVARLPIICFIAACAGLLFHDLVGVNPLGAALSMACAIAAIRALDVHVPPAVAVALLPMVMNRPTIAYPLAVAFGTTLLALWFVAFRCFLSRNAPPS